MFIRITDTLSDEIIGHAYITAPDEDNKHPETIRCTGWAKPHQHSLNRQANLAGNYASVLLDWVELHAADSSLSFDVRDMPPQRVQPPLGKLPRITCNSSSPIEVFATVGLKVRYLSAHEAHNSADEQV